MLQLWHIKFGMSSTPAHLFMCPCAQLEHRVDCTHIPRLNCLCTIHHDVKRITVFCWYICRFGQLCFAPFLFLCNPISGWSTSRSNRPNVTRFPGCSQIFFLSKGLFNRSVRKHCRFPALSFRSTWRCSWMGPYKKFDGYIFNPFDWLRKMSALCNSYGSYNHI